MRRRYCWMIGFILLTANLAKASPYTLYRFEEKYPPRLQEINLPHQFLLPNSEVICISGIRLMREVDYDIFYIDGRIVLYNPPEDTVQVKYEIFPLRLREHYFHRSLKEAPPRKAEGKADMFLKGKRVEEESPFQFTRSGSIFRTITVGSNRDASLESGMDLKINGRLGKGVTVTAALSDQNIPLQPEGDTRTLDEIDKVYVKVESDNYRLNLGDYDLTIGNREFASVERKLTGAQVSTAKGNYEAMISGAASQGEYRSQSFTGVEGLQGPYLLSGKRGESGILVLAGSEKVWLDGILLIRGDDYDYIIDYSRGELTFTEKNPIDADSRIVVDFQYSSGDYSRSLYHSAGNIKLAADRITISYAAGRESDNRGDLLAAELTDSAKTALKSAGDNPAAAYLEGGQYVGMGEGNYIKSFNPDSSFIYIWAGEDSGDYEVTFSYVGLAEGSYSREYSAAGDIYYEYAGESNGDYEPIVVLPLPRREEALDMGIQYMLTQKISCNLETAVSRFDRNTYSSFDDSDNSGGAAVFSMQADSLTLFESGSFNPQAGFYFKTRAVEDNFHPLDRTQEAEYNRKWGYADTLSAQEQSADFQGYVMPLRNTRAAFGAGIMRKSGFQSNRWNGEFAYQNRDLNLMKGYYEDISTDVSGVRGFWRRGKGEAWHWWKMFKPGLRLEGEDQSQAGEGFRFAEGQGFLQIGREEGLLVEQTYRRDETRLVNHLSPLAELNRSHLNYRWSSGNSRYNFDYTHSLRHYQRADSADVKSDLGKIELASRSEDGFTVLNIQHRITQSRTAETALIPLEVGWGEGDYIKEGNQYYPDPNGNYLLISQMTGNYLKSAKVLFSGSLRLDFRKYENRNILPGAVQLMTSETFFSVNEESKTGEPYKLYLLYLPAFRGDSTLYGTSAFRQEVYYRKGDRDFSLRLSFSDNRSLNNRLVSAGEHWAREEYTLRLWKALGASLALQSAAAYSWENRWLAQIMQRDLDFYSWENILINQLSRPLEIRMTLKMETAKEKVEDLNSFSLMLQPQADYAIFGRGRISGQASWTGVYSQDESLPYEMTKGSGKGDNYEWSLQASYRLGKNLNLSLNYTGESKVGRPVIHTGRMELRAFF